MLICSIPEKRLIYQSLIFCGFYWKCQGEHNLCGAPRIPGCPCRSWWHTWDISRWSWDFGGRNSCCALTPRAARPVRAKAQGDAVPRLTGQSLAFKISVRSGQHCTKNVQLVFSLPAKQGQRSLFVPVEHLPLSHSLIQQPQLSLALKSFFLQEPEAGAVIARS